MADLIIKGARENNLKSIDVTIPSDMITVVVGPSGSGKSSLVFDTIYAEGQRRYIESLSSYARQFLERIDKPDVEFIDNISPTVAVEQRNRIKSSRGTVATITEIYDYLKLLYAKIGVTYCPKCKTEVKRYTVEDVVNELIKNYQEKRIYILFKFKGSPQDLIMSGFVRIFVNGEMLDLSEGQKVDLPPEYYVVYDRFKISESEINRIWEAVERVTFLGNRECIIYSVDDNEYKSFIFDNVCPTCRTKFNELDPRLFSFDSPVGACPECKGFGNTLKVDEKKIVPDPTKSLFAGALEMFTKPSVRHLFYSMINFMRDKDVDVNKPFNKLSKKEKDLLYEGGGKGKNRFYGLNKIFKELERKKYKVYIRVLLNKYKSAYTCDVCNGTRLVPEALYVKVAGKNISEINEMCITEFYKWLGSLKLTEYEAGVSKEIMKQLFQRTSFVNEIGLGYLTLNRLAKTLSNGEAQRINLSNQLGSSLVDTIYVLDEPTIGLHPRDVGRLTGIIKKIRDNGNRVIVVEHDPDVIKACDHIIELGPESGARGGQVVFSGSVDDFISKANTLTSKYVRSDQRMSDDTKRKVGTATHFLTLKDIKENNLKNVTMKLPLNRFVCVTGVSGSGKSSLITKSLYPILKKYFDFEPEEEDEDVHHQINYSSIEGVDKIKGVMLIDQDALSRSQRSIPITFISGFDNIRELFAQTALSKSRGYTSSNFSFNVAKGQCPACKGEGYLSIDMQFMADIYIKCDTCNGARYKKEILDVTYNGKNINEVLGMTVEESYDFFISSQPLRAMFKLLIDVGLDYLVIGQPASTLSGGESQRLKICKELLNEGSKKKKSHILYIMDEPTTGLHPQEVEKLLVVLQKLVDQGNSIVVIEHNMDLVKHADYIIDIGPEAGNNGGKIIAEGTPREVMGSKVSHTGQILKRYL
ncbi:MAG: excinuclease ABC subunit UvrA [bacterium]